MHSTAGHRQKRRTKHDLQRAAQNQPPDEGRRRRK